MASSVAFSPDGQRLASSSHDGTVKVWDARTGQESPTFKGQIGGGTSMAFSPDGQRLASAGGATVRVWDARPGQEILTLKRHASGFTRLGSRSEGARPATHLALYLNV